VDIDCAREARCVGVFQPPVIGLPAAGLGDEHDVAAAGVIQAVFGKRLGRENFRDSQLFAEQSRHALHDLGIGILHEHMRELMVRKRPGLAAAQIQ
jgi:hypothetical protein